MTDTRRLGKYHLTQPKLTAQECVYPLPTVAEVVAAGYPATHWDQVKADRDDLLRRFDADPAFRAQAIAAVVAARGRR